MEQDWRVSKEWQYCIRGVGGNGARLEGVKTVVILYMGVGGNGARF